MRDDQSLWGFMTLSDAVRADDVGSFCDSLWLTLGQNAWANPAAQDCGSRASHGAAKASPPSGFDPLSQVSTRDGECANNGSPTDK